MVCSRCGAELPDDVVVCTNCGYVVDKMRFDGISSYVSKGKGGVSIAARIFMIIGCIANFFFLLYYGGAFISAITLTPINECIGFAVLFGALSFAWTIPMTVKYFSNCKKRLKTSIGLKVCTILFVNVVAGILMCCED